MLSDTMTHKTAAGLFYREYGSRAATPAAPPLVWIHGLGESGLCFERIASDPRLSSAYQIVPDLPGYGRSPWARQPLGLEQAGELLFTWLQRAGLLPATLIGHSMGGVLVQLLAERHPDAVAGFVDVDGNLTPADCVFSGEAVENSLPEFMATGFDQLRDSVYRLGLEQPALRGYYSSLRLADPRAFYLNSRELVDLSAPRVLAKRLAALEIPTIYIAGRPGGASAGSLEELKAAKVATAVIEPSGHWPFLDQPGDFLDALVCFLETLG